MDLLIKALDPNTRRIGGILIPFGSTTEKDSDKEYFSEKTDGITHYLDLLGAIPILTQHNKMRELIKMFGKKFNFDIPDDVIVEIPVGRIEKMTKTPEGWYAEGIIKVVNEAHKWYEDAIYELIDNQKMHWSSGATPLPRKARVAEDGHINLAYVLEATTTPTPANPRKTRVASLAAVKSALKSFALSIPEELETVEEIVFAGENPLPDADKMMSVDETTRYIHEAFEKNERANAESEGRYPAYPADRYDDHLIVSQGGMGRKYFRVPYTRSGEKEVSFAPFAQWQEVKREWVPVETAPMMSMAQKQALARLRIEHLTMETLC